MDGGCLASDGDRRAAGGATRAAYRCRNLSHPAPTLRARSMRVRASGARLRRRATPGAPLRTTDRSAEHTSELQSLMRISYAIFCLKKKQQTALVYHSVIS